MCICKKKRRMKNGSQTQIHVLHDRPTRMDEVRLLTRMARKVRNRIAPNSSMAYAKRSTATIHAVATIASSVRSSAHYTTSSTFGCYSTNTVRRAVPDLYQGTRETDDGTASPSAGSTARSHPEETRRTKQMRRCGRDAQRRMAWQRLCGVR